ncbi:uncharacterized protein LOC144123393 [Amblyomma americanum]
MNNYENFRRGQNEAIYSDGFFNTVRGHRYPAVPAASAVVSLSSTAELISSGRAPFEVYRSCPHLASLASPSPVLPSMTSLAIGDSEESSSTSLSKGLPSKSLNCMPLLVFVLVLCVFVTLAIWATALLQDELHDSHIEAMDDVDAGKHFAKFGGLKPSAGSNEQTSTGKQGLKITARTGKRTRSKRTSTPLDDSDVSTTNLEYRVIGDKEHDREQPLVTGGKSSYNAGATVTRPRKPVHRRRRIPRQKRTARSTRRRPSKRIHRQARKQAAVPPLTRNDILTATEEAGTAR